jgi:hypothetical protein
MKKKKLLIPLLICVVVLIGLIYVIPHSTPVGAIRAHLFPDYQGKALSCSVSKSTVVDRMYGQQYSVGNCNGIYFAYVKRNTIGLYYWSGGGSGP